MKTKTFKSALKIVLAIFLLSPIIAMAQQPKIDNMRGYDKSGINIFEAAKDANTTFDGVKVRIGAGFTQQMQGLSHENTELLDTGGMPMNGLYDLGPGFNLAVANLNLDAQLADGIRVNVQSYMSSRHHAEFWVKGGFIQFDKLPFGGETVAKIMEVTRITLGHMEVNYGDAHFRRTDNGNALYNPFVENYIMDAFTTEIGGEILVQKNGIFGQLGVFNGEIKGHVQKLPEVDGSETDESNKKAPGITVKAGYDKQVNDDLRVRVSGSVYTTSSSARNTLMRGDRCGSHYWLAAEKADASAGSQAWSGRYNPNFTDQLTAMQFNAFVKWTGLEFFGTYETVSGSNANELTSNDNRTATQIAADLLYRIGQNENAYVGARYNMLTALPSGGPRTDAADVATATEVTIDRVAIAAGWFINNSILLKGEYVIQNYNDFYNADNGTGNALLHGANFSGWVLEAVIGF